MSTLSEQTKASYRKRAKACFQRYKNVSQKDLSGRQEYIDFLQWQDQQKHRLSPATCRQYRAAIVYYSEQKWRINLLQDYPDFLQGGASKRVVRQHLGKRTSALKNKKVDSESWQSLQNHLQASKSTYARLAINMITGSIALGLRPVEWTQCELIDYQHTPLPIDGRYYRYTLKVKNAKTSQNRSFGVFRQLHFGEVINGELEQSVNDFLPSVIWLASRFSELRQHQRFHITHLEQLGDHQEADKYHILADKMVRHVGKYLNQVYLRHSSFCNTPQNKRITLYSARHQFAANAKKNGLEPLTIAALMGHGSIHTNKQFYGRRMNGQGGFGVAADPNDKLAIQYRQMEQEMGMDR